MPSSYLFVRSTEHPGHGTRGASSSVCEVQGWVLLTEERDAGCVISVARRRSHQVWLDDDPPVWCPECQAVGLGEIQAGPRLVLNKDTLGEAHGVHDGKAHVRPAKLKSWAKETNYAWLKPDT